MILAETLQGALKDSTIQPPGNPTLGGWEHYPEIPDVESETHNPRAFVFVTLATASFLFEPPDEYRIIEAHPVPAPALPPSLTYWEASMRHRCVLGIAALALVVTACTAAPAGLTPEDEAAIRAAIERWGENVRANRLMDVLDLYSDDAVEVLATERVGKAAIRERWEGFVDRYEYETASSTANEIEGLGDLAYVRMGMESTYLYDGNPRNSYGNVLLIFRKQADGTWLISRSAWGQATAARTDTTASY